MNISKSCLTVNASQIPQMKFKINILANRGYKNELVFLGQAPIKRKMYSMGREII